MTPGTPFLLSFFDPENLQNRPYVREFFLVLGCAIFGAAAIVSEQRGVRGIATWLPFGLAFLCGSYYAAKEMWAELREGVVSVDLLMILVAVGAFTIDAEAEAIVLLFLFSLSGALESFAQYRTERALDSLYHQYPENVLRRRDGEWECIKLAQVTIGDELLLKPGELVPTDGNLREGAITVDESALTGESLPVEKSIGDKTFGGTLLRDGTAVIEVTKLPTESAVQKLFRLVESARETKSPSQQLADLVGRYYTAAVLALSSAAFVLFHFALELGWDAAFYRTMTLLVVSSPCALVLSIPSAILTAIASGARRGILFRSGRAIENLVQVNHYALDKTGTLTSGHFRVIGVVSSHGSDDALLSAAASLEQFSTHPLAAAIVDESKRRGYALLPVESVKNVAGGGMEGLLNNSRILVGSRSFLERNGVSLVELPRSESSDDQGCAEVCVSLNGEAAIILLRDQVRPGSARAIRELRKLGSSISLISGDREGPVRAVCRELDIEDHQSEVSPEQKLQWILQLKARGMRVAMTGDGINDAPALAASDVAIAMGDRASDSAIEESDLVLMGGKIEMLPTAVQLSRRARSIIIQNLALSMSVVVVLVFFAVRGVIPLSLGVFGHEGSTVLVVLNSLRLLRTPRTD